jgi:hypothetical protein
MKGKLQQGKDAPWLLDEETGEALVKSKEQIVLYDDAADPINYLGKAPFGSADDAAVWQIRRIDLTTGVVMKAADGNANFDNIWDDRASLTYT